MKKIVSESLYAHINFNSINEISDFELQKKIAKAKEEGRKISPEYEKNLWAKQSKNKDADTERKREKLREERAQAYKKREKMVEELQPILEKKVWKMNEEDVTFRYIAARDNGIAFTISTTSDKKTKGYLLYKDVQDDLILYNATGSNDTDRVSIQKISDAFGMLTQIFKKYYPESKYADRKIWSSLS